MTLFEWHKHFCQFGSAVQLVLPTNRALVEWGHHSPIQHDTMKYTQGRCQCGGLRHNSSAVIETFMSCGFDAVV